MLQFSLSVTVALSMCLLASTNGNIISSTTGNIVSPSVSRGPREDLAVTKFREFLRINTAYPNPDYEKARHWLKKQAKSIGLEFNYLPFKKPDLFACWLTWKGSDPSLKSILLNSHMDMVFVEPSKWEHDPFGAFKDINGNIYARGAQDMKNTIVARIEAIRALKKEGFVPRRDVHVAVMPGEEPGGMHGMEPFANSRQFKDLRIGFDMDEASASETDVMSLSYGQKNAWQIKVSACGTPGHGSSAGKLTAGVKISIIIQKMMEFRQEQIELMENTPGSTPSDITTVNMVIMEGGLAANVLPDCFYVTFDIRIRIKENWTFTDMQKLLDGIMTAAGDGVSYEFLQKSLDLDQTATDETNPWFVNLKETFDNMNWKYQPAFAAPTTDARYIRRVGIPALGFNPGVNLTKTIIHQHNEFYNEKDFLEQIKRYKIIFRSLTMVPGSVTP